MEATATVVSSEALSDDQNAEDIVASSEDTDSYWAFLKGKLEAAKAWADDFINKLGGA